MKDVENLGCMQHLQAEIERLKEENLKLQGKLDNLAKRADAQAAGSQLVEDEIQKSRIYAESIVETTQEPLLVLRPDLTVNSANSAFYELFQINPEQALGRKIYDLGNGQWNIPSLRKLLQQVLPANHVFKDYEVHHDIEDIGPRVMLLNARRLDHVQLILLGIRDITQQYEFETKIRQSAERLQKMINIPGVGVLIFNKDGLLLDANDWFLQMFGYGREEVAAGNLSWRTLTPPEYVDISEQQMEKLSELGRICPYEKEYLRKDGSRSWMVFAGANLGDGTIIEYCIDVSDRKKVEKELSKSEERFRALVKASSDIIYCMSPDWTEMRQFLGQDFIPDTKEPSRDWLLKYIPPEDRPQVKATIDEAIRTKSTVELVHRVLRPDGSLGRTFSRAIPLIDESGEIIEWFGMAKDITERRRAEVALRESEERCRVLVEAESQAVWETNAEGVVVEDSPSWRAYTGQSLEDWLRYGWIDAIHPEDQEYAGRQWREAVAAVRNVDAEFRLRSPDGGWRWTKVLHAPVRDESGNILKWVGMNLDITERKEAEEALRESEAKYRSLFENIDAGFCIVEMIFDDGKPVDYRFLEMNPSFEKQTGLINARGRTMRELAPQHEEHWFEIYGRIALSGKAERFENRAEQLHRWYDVFAFRHGPPEKRQVAILFNDITERKKVEEDIIEARKAAEKANQAKSEFLATMSHEIRTPMTAFLMAVDQLLDIDKSPERRHLLKMADQSARHLRSLIDDILDIARIEAGKVEIKEVSFDLRACVRETMDMFTLPAQEKDLRLEMEVEAEVPEMVVGDAARLGQVLINLVGNAVKFTHEGQVRVSVQRRDDLLQFVVVDTGIGIPEEKCEAIFESFTQADGSLTRQYGGTGLGLAICKGLVELMGGDIFARSKQGQGSVFTFTLPLKTAQGQKSAPDESVPEPACQHKAAARILLAEDDPMIREMLVMMLATKGWQAETAISGREAVAKCTEGDFDIILMDLQMPEMDGLEATREIRKGEVAAGRRACIVGLTGHAQREIENACLKAGMDRVLTKPVRMAELYAVIDSCLSA